MEFRHLNCFVAAAEELHFGRAAARLHMAQPNLSQQIKQFEKHLGTPLFARTHQRVDLTEAGRVLLPRARELLEKMAAASEAVGAHTRGETGVLRLGYTAYALVEFLPCALLAFSKACPNVRVKLRSLPVAEQVRALADRALDAAVVLPPLDNMSQLSFQIVMRERLAAAMPASHRLGGNAPLHVRDLAEEPLIFPCHAPAAGDYHQVMALFKKARVAPRVAQEVEGPIEGLSLARAGMGVALVPLSMRPYVGSDIVLRPLGDEATAVNLAVAWRRDEPGPVVNNFLSVVRKACGVLGDVQSPPSDGGATD
jgi:DNA-binding transcriptional LysR family regulator